MKNVDLNVFNSSCWAGVIDKIISITSAQHEKYNIPNINKYYIIFFIVTLIKPSRKMNKKNLFFVNMS